jgi:hypothetical protein
MADADSGAGWKKHLDFERHWRRAGEFYFRKSRLPLDRHPI